MRTLAFELKPRGPFHFGERGVGLEETDPLAHSDTVFSALCWAWALLYGEDALGELLERFEKGSPPFLVSSAFPYAGGVRFLPRPLILPGQETLAGEELRRLRKVGYVSWEVFSSLAAGSVPEKALLIQGGRLWMTQAEFEELRESVPSALDEAALTEFLREWAGLGRPSPPAPADYARCYRLWRVGEVPHVTVDRVTSASGIFHEGDVYFGEGCGIYILVRFLDEGYREKFEAALRLLGDEGLGGRRSYGRGQFDVGKPKEVELPRAEAGSRILLLSLLNPKEDELPILLGRDDVAYRLLPRRGWVYSARARNLRRKRVMMFAEGSILAHPPKEPVGRLVKVLEKGGKVPHDVYRYGYGFWVRW